MEVAPLKIAILSVPFLCVSSLAQAQDCSQYVGQVVSPLSYAQALAKIPHPTPKGEFESRANYDARTMGMSSPMSPIIIAKTPDPIWTAATGDNLIYDADRQVFRVRRYMFGNFNPSFGILWGDTKLLNGDPNYPRHFGAIGIAISVSRQTTARYNASNAFGGRTTVARMTEIQNAVYDHGTADSGADLFLNEEGEFVGEVKVPADQARVFKATAFAAFVVAPKMPYFQSARQSARRATFHYPFEIDTELNTIFADIQCGLLLDGRKRVVAAFTTR